jgi:hypothetical protein
MRSRRPCGLRPFDGGVAYGGLRAFARVEGVVEGETVVALRHRVVRARERALRRGEFLGGEPIGAGRARGLDRGWACWSSLSGEFRRPQ